MVVVVAVVVEAFLHAVEEAGQDVAVPVLEHVGVGGEVAAPSLVGEDGEFVDDVRVLGPAGRDEGCPGRFPAVLAVDPGGDGVQPLPEFPAESAVGAGGGVPGMRQVRR